MGVLYGAYQGPTMSCDLGINFHISQEHLFVGKSNIRSGSNNRNELSSLLSLLTLAINKRVFEVQVFGDSKLCIDWMFDSMKIFQVDSMLFGNKLKNILRKF